MQNPDLAADYLRRAGSRLKALAVLMAEQSWADVVREAQEVVEICLTALLRSARLEVPRIHDVSGILEDNRDRLPATVLPRLVDLTRISRALRRDRELAFYGSEDLTPSQFYRDDDAREALANAHLVYEVVSAACSAGHDANQEEPHREAAMAAIAAAAGRASRDPTRPVYHLLPPAQWMNDVCGTIHHRGWYHVCYLIDPFGDHITREQTWGHARSRDLVHWEHLPLPFWPAGTAGEEGIYTGGAAINGHGQPMFFWSANPRQGSGLQRTTAAALGDDRMIGWRKLADNPILRRGCHGDPHFDGEWDAPFLFTEQGRTFLILSARQDCDPVLPLDEAVNRELSRWAYRGVMFRTSGREVGEIECQNFVRLGDRWVLLYSPDDTQMRYHAGRFDLDSLTFTPETTGIVDHAFGPGNDSRERGFYASNVLPAPDGRQLLIGWVSGFRDAGGALYMRRDEGRGRGWNGCVSLPRVMSLDAAGQLRQAPAAELQQLRHAPASLPRTELDNAGVRVPGASGNTLEVKARLRPDAGATSGLRLRSGGAGRDTAISYDGHSVDVAGTRVPLQRPAGEPLTLHLFLDRSVLEAFLDDGRECVTRVIDPLPPDATIEVFAERGRSVVESLEVWHLRSIW